MMLYYSKISHFTQHRNLLQNYLHNSEKGQFSNPRFHATRAHNISGTDPEPISDLKVILIPYDFGVWSPVISGSRNDGEPKLILGHIPKSYRS